MKMNLKKLNISTKGCETKLNNCAKITKFIQSKKVENLRKFQSGVKWTGSQKFEITLVGINQRMGGCKSGFKDSLPQSMEDLCFDFMLKFRLQ